MAVALVTFVTEGLARFAKSRSRMKVPDVGKNLVPDTWTADGENALPELGPCPNDKSCVGCRGTEMAASRLRTV